MSSGEKIRCNVCDVMIDANEVESHLSKPTHLSSKAKLDDNLSSLHKEMKHKSNAGGSSVQYWKNSLE